jgi:predicted RNA-binding Zn ribbon-like protein
VDHAEHGAAPVDLAVALVNELTPGDAQGSTRARPSAEQRPAVLGRALRDRPNRARAWVDADAAEFLALAGIADTLREVFEAAERGDDDGAAGVVNRMLAHGDVRPVLSDHDGEPWHLHAHWPDVSPSAALRATCALGIAELLADGGARRLGVCAADVCDRVFRDTSRNGSRRFCCEACQARAKTAAFRARRTG